MKNVLLLFGNRIWKYFLAVFIVSLLFNGCKKDSKLTPSLIQMPDNIAKAKTWYESKYPVVTSSKTTSTALRTLDTKPKTGPIDFTQFINPDWYHPASYNRLNKDVVELPIAPGSQLNSVLKNMGNKIPYGNKDYSRSSFLILQDEQGYKAYIMTIIADSSYVRGDTSKLSRNTYRKHDPDFSGLVLYFTPKGEYVNGYKYLNGKLSTGSSQENKGTNSLKTNKLKVNTERVCEDWYLVTWVDDEIVDIQYLYTECYGGDEGGGGGPPSPCQGSNSINDKKKILTENPDDYPPGDEGMDPPGSPCVITQDIRNNVTDSCVHQTVDKILDSKGINGLQKALYNLFSSSTTLNLNITESYSMPGSIYGQAYPPNVVNGITNINLMLNAQRMPGTSKENAAAVIIHEVLHAYMAANGLTTALQHETMAVSYINQVSGLLQTLYPGLSEFDATALSWGGLQGTGSWDILSNLSPAYRDSLQDKQINYMLALLGTKCN